MKDETSDIEALLEEVVSTEATDEGDEAEQEHFQEEDAHGEDDETGNEDEEADDKVSHEKLSDNSEQLAILDHTIDTTLKEEAKLEAKAESLKEKQPDLKAFNANIQKYITDEEYEARLDDDPTLFIEAVTKARKKYEEEHGHAKELQELQDKITEVQAKRANLTAIREVSKRYPDFDFNAAKEFFNKKLTGEQKEEITTAKSPKEGLLLLYKMMTKTPIKRTEAPNKPRLDSAKKGTAKGEHIHIKEEREEYLKKIGLGKGR